MDADVLLEQTDVQKIAQGIQAVLVKVVLRAHENEGHFIQRWFICAANFLPVTVYTPC